MAKSSLNPKWLGIVYRLHGNHDSALYYYKSKEYRYFYNITIHKLASNSLAGLLNMAIYGSFSLGVFVPVRRSRSERKRKGSKENAFR